VRNLYADELRPVPIATLLRELPEVWEVLEDDLEAFEAWVEAVAQEASRPPVL
jgi:hypothetical protein